MRAVAKTLIWFVIAPLGMCIGPLFFDRKYLSGRHFANRNLAGWRWFWRAMFYQKLLGWNRSLRFPVSPLLNVSNGRNIEFHPDDLNNFQTFGCYFQNIDAKITLGRGTYIAPNVGLITTNHDPLDPDKHLPGSPITLGEKCWVGMNAVILPGVTLGDRTIVAAGAVVTKSVPEGWCILAGIPAKPIKDLRPEEPTP